MGREREFKRLSARKRETERDRKRTRKREIERKRERPGGGVEKRRTDGRASNSGCLGGR